jgi:23S rRNA pseudouridine1911/1915/1917 synthase
MIKIIAEDNHIIVVNKPCNVLVMEDSTKDIDMLTMVKEYIKVKYQKPGNVYVGLVHRLDRPVGGIMVFAKTSKAASRLSEIIRTHKMEKYYLAVCRGELIEKSGEIKDYLYKNAVENKSYAVDKNQKGSKQATLEYEVIGVKQGYSLLKIKLITGRHHQIRVQLANIGFPIFGDQKYNDNTRKAQIALWAYELSFVHPVKKELVSYQCKPDFMVFPWSLFI